MGFRHGVSWRPGFKNGASDAIDFKSAEFAALHSRGVSDQRNWGAEGPEDLGGAPRERLELRVLPAPSEP